jgi:hypothetical protein
VKIYRSRNGSRIPNPYVDNARPHPSLRTWATVGRAHVQVYVYQTIGMARPAFVAHVHGAAEEAYGVGPSEAVRSLDKVLSARRNG